LRGHNPSVVRQDLFDKRRAILLDIFIRGFLTLDFVEEAGFFRQAELEFFEVDRFHNGVRLFSGAEKVKSSCSPGLNSASQVLVLHNFSA